MAYVVKIKYEDTLRRLTYESKPRGEDLSYARLESKIRDLFKLHVHKSIRVTYNDTDGDVITMADDQDLVDALIVQSLNPLRLFVTLAKSTNSVSLTPAAKTSLSHASDAGLSQLSALNDLSRARYMLRGLSPGPEIQQVLSSHGSAGVGQVQPFPIAELLDVIAKNLMIDIPSLANKNSEMCLEADRSSSEQTSSLPSESNTATSAPRSNVLPMSGRSSETCALPFRRGEAVESVNAKSENLRVLHSSVKCDGCGMSPIAGPRFKSIRKHDYDLCQSCFKESGIDVDYTRIDRPLLRPRQLHALSRARMRSPVSSANLQSARSLSANSPYYGGRHASLTHQMDGVNERRLDARFVQDVTIMDGAELLPGTIFTKVWRLHNSGTVSWPPQTKLIHVAGNDLGNFFDVPLQLPEHGLLPNQEVDASVEFIAPEKPGRYVSHWRLAAPAGTKFGHRVWVLIQVVSKRSSGSGEKQSNLGMLREDEESDNSSHLSSPVVAGTREAFVKASHRRFLAQRANRIRNASSRSWPRYVDVEEPFSGMRIRDVELSTERKNPIQADPAEAKVEEEVANMIDEKVTPARTPRIGLLEILPTTDERDQYDVAAPIATVEQPSSTLVEECSNTNSDGDAKSDNFNAFVEVVYPDSDAHTQAKAEEDHAECVDQEDVVTVDNSELEGGFSMVDMPVEHELALSPMSKSVKFPTDEGELGVSTADGTEASSDHEDRETQELGSPEELCDRLEAMGFMDRELNMELLVNNELDLRRTLNDLVKASEWDPILEELKEMGFSDRQMNLRLMFENKGSVKRVVKSLVQMNKEPVLVA